MRFGPADKFWMVLDPEADSTLGDIWFATSVEGFINQVRGGLNASRNLTLHTDQVEARADAEQRMLARETAKAVTTVPAEALGRAHRIQVVDREGQVLAECTVARVGDIPLTGRGG